MRVGFPIIFFHSFSSGLMLGGSCLRTSSIALVVSHIDCQGTLFAGVLSAVQFGPAYSLPENSMCPSVSGMFTEGSFLSL